MGTPLKQSSKQLLVSTASLVPWKIHWHSVEFQVSLSRTHCRLRAHHAAQDGRTDNKALALPLPSMQWDKPEVTSPAVLASTLLAEGPLSSQLGRQVSSFRLSPSACDLGYEAGVPFRREAQALKSSESHQGPAFPFFMLPPTRWPAYFK